MYPELRLKPSAAQPPRRDAEARLAEAVGLALAIDLNVVASGIVPVPAPRPATLIGAGKVEEIKALVRAEDIELVVVDAALSPVQQRNLERAWQAKVLDRTGLILEIFGARARTKEGRLQVELAHLAYQKSRLVRSWTHLERQRGGVGFLGGPGETQIEADRRMIQERMTRLQRQLDKVQRTRGLHRSARKRVPYPIVALVGYTNAGKSTLFNRLTSAEVVAEDMLFATLDPTLRKLALPGGGEVIVSDTVGFISELPTQLVAAFRATLEEVIEADLILHVRDMSHADSEAQRADVAEVLASLDIDPADADHIVEVWNKIDLLDEGESEALINAAARLPSAVAVSALTGKGIGDLVALIEQRVAGLEQELEVILPADAGRTVNWIYENGQVTQRTERRDGSVVLQVRVSAGKLDEFRQRAAKAIVA